MVRRARPCEATRVTSTRLEIAGLTTRIVGPPDARLTCVLLHGFGASGEDLVSLATEIDAPVRLVFPAAPLELGGLYGNARAWWMLDIARLEDAMRRGVTLDLRADIPDGLAEARGRLSGLLDALAARFALGDDQLVLGGFSQGAMLSLDVALHRPRPPAGLILMSGTLIAEPVWQPRMAALAGVPVVMSHGRHDPLLPYPIAEQLRDRLTEAGAAVDWQPFLGGHEIPQAALDAVNRLLRRLAQA
jgi:phospholipase/carboxylesterase